MPPNTRASAISATAAEKLANDRVPGAGGGATRAQDAPGDGLGDAQGFLESLAVDPLRFEEGEDVQS